MADPATKPETNQDNNVFAKYNKQFAGNTGGYDEQQVETVATFGRQYREVKGTAGRPDIARTMVNGRHELSNSILNGFAVAGAQVDAETQKDLDELDNLAQASVAISEMDNETRASMSVRGHKGMDPYEIDKRENDIARRVMDRNRNILQEDEQINRTLKRYQLQNTELTVKENYRTAELNAENAKAEELTKNMTAKELELAANNGGIPGISHVKLLDIRLQRTSAEYTLIAATNQLDPKSMGNFAGNPNDGGIDNPFLSGNPTQGNPTTTGGGGSGGGKPIAGQDGKSRANVFKGSSTNDDGTTISGAKAQADAQINYLASLSPEIRAGMYQQMKQEQLDEAASNGGKPSSVIPTALVPGTSARVTKYQLDTAENKSLELENKLGISHAQSFRIQSALLQNRHLLKQADFHGKMKSVGVNLTGPNSPASHRIARQREAFSIALDSGDINAAKEISDEIGKTYDKLSSEVVMGAREEDKPAFVEVMETGKFVAGYTAGSYLANRTPQELLYNLTDNPVLKDLGHYVLLQQSQPNKVAPVDKSGKGIYDAEKQEDFLSRFTENGPKSKTLTGKDLTNAKADRFIGTINDESLQKIAVEEAQEHLVKSSVYSTLNGLITATQERVSTAANSGRGVIDQNATKQLNILTNLRSSLFGRVHQQMQLQPVVNGIPLVVEEPFTEIDRETGIDTPLVGADGAPVMQKNVNAGVLMTLMYETQLLLDDVGEPIDFINQVINNTDQVAATDATRYAPKNMTEMALLYGVNKNYRNNITTDGETAMAELFGIANGNAKSFMLEALSAIEAQGSNELGRKAITPASQIPAAGAFGQYERENTGIRGVAKLDKDGIIKLGVQDNTRLVPPTASEIYKKFELNN
jgi:hypothetical protein